GSAEQIAYRHAEAASPKVVQRAVEPRLRLIVSEHQPVEVIEDADDLARVAPDERFAEKVKRALHRFMGSAIMIHGGGVAVADGVVLGTDAHDPALGHAARRQREFPVLVLLRQDRFIGARLNNLHPPSSRVTDANYARFAFAFNR